MQSSSKLFFFKVIIWWIENWISSGNHSSLKIVFFKFVKYLERKGPQFSWCQKEIINYFNSMSFSSTSEFTDLASFAFSSLKTNKNMKAIYQFIKYVTFFTLITNSLPWKLFYYYHWHCIESDRRKNFFFLFLLNILKTISQWHFN